MPSNHILINNGAEYIVVDSKMDDLLQWLKQNATATDTGIKKGTDETALKATSYNQIEA